MQFHRKRTIIQGITALIPAAAASAAPMPILSPAANVNIPITSAGIYVNVVTGLVTTSPTGNAGWDLNFWGTGGFNIWANNASEPANGVMTTPGGSTTLIGALSSGTFVDSSDNFLRSAGSQTGGFGGFQTNSANYFGFRFFDESDSSVHYGWGTVLFVAQTNLAPRTLVELWYEAAADTGIAVVPEPSSATLLALGAAGVAALRRRKRK